MNSSVHGAEFFLGKIVNTFKVLLGQNKCMAYGDGIFVQNGNEFFILIDHVGSSTSMNDVAEDAAQIGDFSFQVTSMDVNLGLSEVNNFDVSIPNISGYLSFSSENLKRAGENTDVTPRELELLQGMVNCYSVCHASFEDTVRMVGSGRGLSEREVMEVLNRIREADGQSEDYKALRSRLPDHFPL